MRLPGAHVLLVDKLGRKLGLDRTTIIKIALYRMGIEEGFMLEYDGVGIAMKDMPNGVSRKVRKGKLG